MRLPRTCASPIPLALIWAALWAVLLPSVSHAQDSALVQPALVQRALANEQAAARDDSHPMRFQLRKSSPRLTTTKNLVETKDGAVALLVSINDLPLGPADTQKEQARLDALLADSGKQRHRKQSEDADRARAMMVLRSLPQAFLYQDAGSISTPAGTAEKFTFLPNPKFNPPNLETQALTALAGEIWIDVAHARVTHLEGRLRQDVDFGWGILGRLSKGGWIVIDQAEVGQGQWRIVKFQMDMNSRVIFKTRNFKTIEIESDFAPVPLGLNYRQAIDLLRSTPAEPSRAAR